MVPNYYQIILGLRIAICQEMAILDLCNFLMYVDDDLNKIWNKS